MSAIPLPMRVYALEGKTEDLDDGITRQGLSLAEHHELMAAHTTTLAVHDTKLVTNAEQISALTSLMNKVIWSLVALSTTIAASAAAIALTVGSG